MNTDLISELKILQQSRQANKYFERIEDYVDDLPNKVNIDLKKPIKYFKIKFSKLVQKRGWMLYSLDQRISKYLNKQKNRL